MSAFEQDLDEFLAGPEPDYDQAPEPPRDADDADRRLRRLAKARAEMAQIGEHAQAQIERINEWHARWLAKLADHGDGIALVFARTETAGFVREVWGKADSLLFLHGRLHFHHPGGDRAKANSGAPSVLVAYGQRAVDRLTDSGLNGTILYDWAQPIAWETAA